MRIQYYRVINQDLPDGPNLGAVIFPPDGDDPVGFISAYDEATSMMDIVLFEPMRLEFEPEVLAETIKDEEINLLFMKTMLVAEDWIQDLWRELAPERMLLIDSGLQSIN